MENGVPATPCSLSSTEHWRFLGPSSIATKGFGLKKWRRFRRDYAKMDSGFVGDNKVLKRDFSMSTTPVIASQSSGSQSSAPNPFPRNSTGSSNISLNNLHFDGFFMKDGHESETGAGFVFSRIPEEINYKISRSCSTVSVPKSGCIIGGLNTELGKDGVDNIISSNAKAVRDRIEITNKHRGDAIKMDRESSLCSGESESGSNFSILQPAGFLCAGEGIETRCSTNNGEESVNGAQQSDEQTKMDRISGSLLDDFDDGLYLEDDTAKNGDTTPSSTNDIFSEIILLLQIAHNALENEKKKLLELTTLVCGPKHVEVKIEVDEDGVKIEGEMENEELFGNKIEAEIKYVILREMVEKGEIENEELFGSKIEYEIKYAIILGAMKGVGENELFKIESEIKYVKEKRRKTLLFRTVSCFLLILTLLLFYNVLPHSTTTTTPTPT